MLLTGNQTLAHEQNLSGQRLAVVALSAIQLSTIRENMPKKVAAIDSAAPGFLSDGRMRNVQPKDVARD